MNFIKVKRPDIAKAINDVIKGCIASSRGDMPPAREDRIKDINRREEKEKGRVFGVYTVTVGSQFNVHALILKKSSIANCVFSFQNEHIK